MLNKIFSTLALSTLLLSGAVSANASISGGTDVSSSSSVSSTITVNPVTSSSVISTTIATTNPVVAPVVKKNTKMVNSKNGLVLRDKNCKRINVLKDKTEVMVGSSVNKGTLPATITCTIGGVKVRMEVVKGPLNFRQLGFMSSKFLK